MAPFKPKPTPSSVRPPIYQTASPPDRASSAPDRPVRPFAHPRLLGPVRLSARPRLLSPVRASSTRPPVHPSAPPGPRPCLFRPSACPRFVGPIRLSTRLSTPFPPPSARLSVPLPPRPSDHLISARPPVRSVHTSSATSAPPSPVRYVRSACARQLPLYIPHPASPQIIQLLTVHVGPRVSVAPLRSVALRGAQGLWEVGVNCRENPCNFFLRTGQHGEGDHLR